MDRFPQRGDVLGARPVVIVGRPDKARFPMVVAVPLTSQVRAWTVAGEETYPVLGPGQAGLTLPSAVLLEHIQGLDERRLIRLLRRLTPDEMLPIQAGLMRLIDGES